MSISILNRGASGGLKPELTVIAPAGSTIDLLQNGIIVDTYTLSASETEHTFVVKVGTYAVRGTLGTDMRSYDVAIDAIGQYRVEIAYILWLYRAGDECEDVTGGFGFGISSKVSNRYAASMFTNNKIDMTKYSKLYYEIQGTYALSGGIDTYVGFSDGTLFGGIITVNTAIQPRLYYNGNLSRELRFLDVSDFNTALHFAIHGDHNAYYESKSSIVRNADSLVLDVWYNYNPGERQYTYLYNAWLE